MKQTDSMLKGIHQLLYGKYRPQIVVDQYKHGDRSLYTGLASGMETPADYLKSDTQIKERWEKLLKADKKIIWTPPFYKSVIPDNEPFHILCKFYNSLIWCESRMIIYAAEVWVDTLEMTLLQYELVELRDQCIELLKEVHGRKKANPISGPDPDHENELVKNIESYLSRTLYTELLMLIDELQLRFHSLFDKRSIGEEELFLKHVEEPVPDIKPYIRTQAKTLFELEKAEHSSAPLEDVKSLTEKAEIEVANYPDKIKPLLIDSLKILENSWLLLFLDESRSSYDFQLTQTSEAAKEIKSIRQDMLNPTGWKKSRRSDKIKRLISRIDIAAETLTYDRKTEKSEALKLVNDCKQIFMKHMAEGTDYSLNKNKPETHDKEYGNLLLDEYLRYEEVQEKLGVTNKPFLRYLRESNTDVVVLSNKEKWIHKSDFQSMMEHFKTQI